MTETLSLADGSRERRILDFTRSEMFERTFREGMVLVEETAAYLDGPGRSTSRQLDRLAAIAYAGESMRLTTRLMQVAAWLLVQRAVRDKEMTLTDARSDKYRLAGRDTRETPAPVNPASLPAPLQDLIVRCEALFVRVQRMDETMYGAAPGEPANEVSTQMDRLRAAFDLQGSDI